MESFSSIDTATARGIRYILFDIDDTVTEGGRLPEESYSAMWAMHRAGFRMVPVTGRPAGWCDLIARQWPVDGVVGENGAFAFYLEGEHLQRLYHPAAPAPETTRARLAAMGGEIIALVPGLRIAKDQPYRIFDVALDFAEEQPDLGLEVAQEVRRLCEKQGARAKVSSIHVNAWYGDYDKLSMAELFLSGVLGWDAGHDPGAVIFFGDSPNDEPMFRRFRNSCGVANIRRFESVLRHPPRWVTERPFGRGFADACDIILKKIANGCK